MISRGATSGALGETLGGEVGGAGGAGGGIGTGGGEGNIQGRGAGSTIFAAASPTHCPKAGLHLSVAHCAQAGVRPRMHCEKHWFRVHCESSPWQAAHPGEYPRSVSNRPVTHGPLPTQASPNDSMSASNRLWPPARILFRSAAALQAPVARRRWAVGCSRIFLLAPPPRAQPGHSPRVSASASRPAPMSISRRLSRLAL